MSLKESLFKSKKAKTFQYEESLPALPVPTLRATLDCYLDSVRAIANDQQYANSVEMCRQFEEGVGRQLQEYLLEYSRTRKNWVFLAPIYYTLNN